MDLFDGRPWLASKLVHEQEMETIEDWADEQGMDCICQGIMQGTPTDSEDENYYSIWSFGTDAERTMFILRFGG